VPGLMDVLARWFGGVRAEIPDRPQVPSAVVQPALSIDDPRLPTASKSRMARLIALISDLEARGDGNVAFASTHAEVRQMRDVHVPRLIASYADIPREHRAEIFRSTGQSASYNLNVRLRRTTSTASPTTFASSNSATDGTTLWASPGAWWA